MDDDCLNIVIAVSIVFVLGVVVYKVMNRPTQMRLVIVPTHATGFNPSPATAKVVPTSTPTPTPTSTSTPTPTPTPTSKEGYDYENNQNCSSCNDNERINQVNLTFQESTIILDPNFNPSHLIPPHPTGGLLPTPSPRPTGLLPTPSPRPTGLLPTPSPRPTGLLPVIPAVARPVHLRVLQKGKSTGLYLVFNSGMAIGLAGFGNVGTPVFLKKVVNAKGQTVSAIMDVNKNFISLKDGNKLGLGGTNSVLLSPTFLTNTANMSQPTSLYVDANGCVIAYNMALRLENLNELYFNTFFPNDTHITVEPAYF